jgi:hypothetical protein
VGEEADVEPVSDLKVAREGDSGKIADGQSGHHLTRDLAAFAALGSARPSGRGGGAVLSRKMLDLQRVAGNTVARRVLARQNHEDGDDGEFRLSLAPDGSAADAAAWLFAFVPDRMDKGTHIIAVTTGNQLDVFTASATPTKLGTFILADKHPPAGVWSSSGDGVFLGPLGTEFRPRIVFMPAGYTGVFAEKVVADVDQFPWKKLLPPFPGEVWLCVREPPEGDRDGGGGQPDAKTPPNPGPTWAVDKVGKAQSALDSAKKVDQRSRPDRLVAWPRKDGKWFVNVWRKGDLRTLELDPHEDEGKFEQRILDATKAMQAAADPSRSTRVQNGATGKPRIGAGPGGQLKLPTGAPFDPTNGMKVNSPPYPARLISHGPEGLSGNQDYESTVLGATVNFTMDLDFASQAVDGWQEFGFRFQTIAYQWELFDISKLTLDQIRGALGRPDSDIKADIQALRDKLAGDPTGAEHDQIDAELTRLQAEVTKRGQDTDSGRTRDMARDVANTWKDTKADLSSPTALIPGMVGLVAVSDLVQLVGAPLSAGFSLLSSPQSDKPIGFSQEGLFLIRCFAQPVITPSDIKRMEAKGLSPIIRAPSVAYLPVKVTPINKRAKEVNNAELSAIAELRQQLDHPPPPFERADVEDRIREAEAGLEDNNVEAIDRAIGRAKAELAKIAAWRTAEHEATPLEDRSSALRSWKAMLDISRTGFAEYEQRLDDDIEKLTKTKARVGSYGLDGTRGRVFRPRMTLASEVDGHVYPLVCNLVEDSRSSSGDGDKVWRLVDVSSDETKDFYRGSGQTHNAAIIDAIETFAGKCGYGRGTLAVRLPLAQLKAATGEDIAVPELFFVQPGFDKRFIGRLKDLAVAAEVAAMFVSGPIGIGIGIVGGIAGAIVAIDDLVERKERGESLLTFEAGMDVLAVVGAVAMVGGAAARLKTAVSLSQRARWVGDSLHVIGVGLMRGQVIVIPASLYMQLASIEKQEQAELDAAEQQGTTANVDRAKYQARRLEAFAQAIKSGVVTVRMAQMAENPELGWNPLKGTGPVTAPPPAADPDAANQALTAKLKELATLLKKRGATNLERQQVIEALRTPNEAVRGALEGYVPRSILIENQAAVAKVRSGIKASNPDVIVGMERGGSFLADVLAGGDPSLAPKIRKIVPIKAEPGPGGKAPKSKFAPEMADRFTALADAGAKKIAIVDYYMGGRTASDLSDLLRKRFASDPKYAGVTVEVYWIRETFGFEKTSGGGTVVDPLRGQVGPKAKGAGMYSQISETVTLALGDDMQSVLIPDSRSPIIVFDDSGNVIRTLHPVGAQSTRQVMIDLINGPAP